jgi:hypothetical protein
MINALSHQSDVLISEILQERPAVHRSETEISRQFGAEESSLPSATVADLASGKAKCYGISLEVARFIANHVDASSKSLETGSGLSTLVFAVCQSAHMCVTPSQTEVDGIRAYANRKGISVNRINFVVAASDKYLTTADIGDLDFVFIDGKHAFPWPIIDWFYTVDRLKQGGIVMVDDTDMISGSILIDFMKADPRWNLLADFKGKTVAFKKMVASVHDVAWHMQPYIVNALQKKEASERVFFRRILRKIRKLFSRM